MPRRAIAGGAEKSPGSGEAPTGDPPARWTRAARPRRSARRPRRGRATRCTSRRPRHRTRRRRRSRRWSAQAQSVSEARGRRRCRRGGPVGFRADVHRRRGLRGLARSGSDRPALSMVDAAYLREAEVRAGRRVPGGVAGYRNRARSIRREGREGLRAAGVVLEGKMSVSSRRRLLSRPSMGTRCRVSTRGRAHFWCASRANRDRKFSSPRV